MSFIRSMDVTFITSLLIISIPLISHSQPSAQTQAARPTKVNQLLSQNSKQFRYQAPSWQPGTVIVYTIGRDAGGHSLPVRAIAFNPDGQFLASGSADKTIKIWNFRAKTLERTFPKNSAQIISVAFSPDGKFLASGSLDGTVSLWDWKKGKLIKTFPKHSDIVTCVTFSPDSQTLASSSGDKTINLWNVRTGTLRRKIVEKQWVTSTLR